MFQKEGSPRARVCVGCVCVYTEDGGRGWGAGEMEGEKRKTTKKYREERHRKRKNEKKVRE